MSSQSCATFHTALIYLFGGVVLTGTLNVPMNQALGQIAVPDSLDAARNIWVAYSEPWQVYNTIRTVVSGLTLLLTGVGIYLIGSIRA